jgi:hypothetical protein
MIFFLPGFLYNNFRHWPHNPSHSLFQRVISWDNFGYFLWLPSLLIHRDPWLQGAWPDAAYRLYEPSDTRYQIHEGLGGRRVSIYHPGMAILSLPAFILGHITAVVAGAPCDGFSSPYRVAYVLWFYLLIFLALHWLLEALERLELGKSSPWFLAVFIAASNLPATLGNHGVYIHTAGFFLMAGLMKLWLRTKSDGLTASNVSWLAGWCGLTLITRPPLALWLFIFLPEIPAFLRSNLSRNLIVFILAAVAAIMPATLLMFYWKEGTGKWTFNLHSETFSFSWQRMEWFLFSARNGWLFYSPVFLLLVPAWLSWWRRLCDIHALFWAACLLGCVALHGSWECWHYGGGYGQRTMTDYYPFLMVPLALAWRRDVRSCISWSWFYRGIFFLLALLNLFQTLQYFTGALTPQHNTLTYYRCQFLKLYPDTNCNLYRYFFPPATFNHLEDLNLSRYDTATVYTAEFQEDGEPFFAQGNEFSSPGIDLPYLSLSDRDHLLLSVQARKSPLKPCYDDSLLAVAYLKSRGRILFYQAKPLLVSHRDSCLWEAGFVVPENFSPQDSVRLYLWNRRRRPVQLHRIQVVKAMPRMKPTYVVR